MTELMKYVNTWFTNLIRCYLARARKICEVLSKLTFSLIKTVFLSSILNLKNAKHLKQS